MLPEGDDRLSFALGAVSQQARDRFVEMFGKWPDTVSVTADMRYVGQSHELEVQAVDGWGDLTSGFHDAHRERFGFDRPTESVEVVNLRAVASGTPPIVWSDLPRAPDEVVPVGKDGVWQRPTLPPGFEIEGPAVVVEDNSATLLTPGDRLAVLADGTLSISC
jgi:N-methylhydantoinase A